jgi:predicted ATPase/transposase/transcriptional regulator with XRE-family HTH domain
MNDRPSFGAWLRSRRKAMDLTQTDLAQRVGCAVSTLRKFEAGVLRPSRQIAERLAAYLDLAVEERITFVQAAREPLPSDQLVSHTQATRSVRQRMVRRYPVSLPIPATALIGREQDMQAACERLLRADVRLLTLIGAPGIGKTRLGLQIAAHLSDAFADGICFVALAPISDPSLVIATIAQALGVKEIAGKPLIDRLHIYLHDRQLLLLLDNFEQVVDAAPYIAALLAAAPRLKVLVTSRITLRVSGEHEYVVPPLALPDLTRLPPVAVLAEVAAVDLFVRRALAVEADFALTDANARAISAICIQLDGLPLAIELAAARIKLLAPHALLARLGQRLTLLTAGGRDLPDRQQTLRAAITWSYDLLDAPEQALFRRFGVFVGGCTLDAAEAICDSNHDLSISVLDGLASLMDQSLLRKVREPDSEPRLMMLETIREYALAQLELSGEADALRRRHAEYYLVLAQCADPELRGSEQSIWFNRLASENDNVRAALTWSQTTTGDAVLGLRLASALGWFWWVHGPYGEGRWWLERALACGGDAPPLVRAQALFSAGRLAGRQGDLEHARTPAEEALTLFQGERYTEGTAFALHFLGSMAIGQGDWAAAQAQLEEARLLFEQVGNTWGATFSTGGLGELALHQGDYARATALFERTLALTRKMGDTRGIAFSLNFLAELASRQGDREQARALFEESLPFVRALEDKAGTAWALSGLAEQARISRDYAGATALLEERLALDRDQGDIWGIANALQNLGYIALHQGDTSLATARFVESLSQYQDLENDIGTVLCLAGLAGVAEAQRQPERAAQLLGAAAAAFETTNTSINPIDQVEYDHILATVQSHLDDAAIAAAWAAGRTFSLEQVSAEAVIPIRKSTASIRKSAMPRVGIANPVSDDLWQRIAPLLPVPPAKKAGRPHMDDRQAMVAIFYVLETGCGWKALPRQFGAASTVNDRFKVWRNARVFDRLEQAGMLTATMLRRLRAE